MFSQDTIGFYGFGVHSTIQYSILLTLAGAECPLELEHVREVDGSRLVHYLLVQPRNELLVVHLHHLSEHYK